MDVERASARPSQDGGATERPDCTERLGFVDRRHAQCDVTEHLSVDAAQSYSDNRPELTISREADDGLDGAIDHLRNQNPCELRELRHSIERLQHGSVCNQIQRHAADIALVEDRLGDDLQDHGISELLGGRDGLIG